MRYGDVASGFAFDFGAQQVLSSDPSTLVPTTQAGDYYILIQGRSGATNTPVKLTARALPFSITDIVQDQGGDGRWVTATITGARFQPGALVKLVRPGLAEVEPARFEVIDATTIIATFDFRNVPHGLYDVAVINPDGALAVLPYRYLVEDALPIDVTIGVGGPRVVPAGQTGLYSISLQSLTNVDTPYVHFTFGAPELGDNARVFDLPYLTFNSNVRGAPDGQRGDVAWASLDSEVNSGGFMLAPGYALDVSAGGYLGMSFSVTTYPGLKAIFDRDFEGYRNALYDARPDLAKQGVLDSGVGALGGELAAYFSDPNQKLDADCLPIFLPFLFNVTAAATPMTRAEFVAEQTAEAQSLRSAVIADVTANAALINLASDAEVWVNAYLGALEESGLLRPEDEAPPIRQDEKVMGLLATLASGILVGPVGKEIAGPATLTAFFEQLHKWYGDTPKTIAPLIGYDHREPGPNSDCLPYDIPVPEVASFADFDLGLSHPTYFQSVNIFTPATDGGAEMTVDPLFSSLASSNTLGALDLQALFDQIAQSTDGGATLSGPSGYGAQQFVPANAALPYTVRFSNPPESTSAANEVRVVTVLDDDLSLRTFRLGDMRIGGVTINLPTDRANFQGDFDLRNALGFIVRVSAGIDPGSRTASWVLQAIDPETGEVLQDATRGLLLPDNTQGRGAGFVSWTAQAAFGAVTGTEITAQARVLLDNQAPFETGTVISILDGAAPETTLTVSLVQAGGSDYLVKWQAVDEAGGSGIRHTTVYVRADGGNWTIWQRQTNETQAVYQGDAAHSYEFLALSVDNAGNRELPPTSDVPGDGTVVDVGGVPEVGRTTQDVGAPPAPSNTASTNVLFVQAQLGVPAAESSRPSLFSTVVTPFSGEVFGTGIGQSFAGIGPLAILDRPDGNFIVSGGGNRGALYLFDQDGGHALAPTVQLDSPVFDLAWDGNGGLWATSGGGQLLELDPDTLEVINRYGDSLTQSLTFDAAKGVFFVSSGNGIEKFDPVARRFSHFSNVRVDDLAVAPDGTLWGTAWPKRGDILTFDNRGRAQVQVRLDAAVDSIVFGRTGTTLEGLLFASARIPSGSIDPANLYMIDLVTLRVLQVARGGPSAEQLLATSDGRLLVANGSQVDVLAPVVAPNVVRTTPPDGALVPLPLNEISVVFDRDMLASAPTAIASVTNPSNYLLTKDGNALTIRSVRWDVDTRTATLRFDALEPGLIELTVKAGILSTQGLRLQHPYVMDFVAVSDFSDYVHLDFASTRSDRGDGTLSFDLQVTNIGDIDLLPPLILILDPAQYFQGSVPGTPAAGGLWLLDLGLGSAGLKPGESTIVRTITLGNPQGQRADLGTGIYALPYPNAAPLITSQPVTAARVGEPYRYELGAVDPDGVGLRYLLLSGPDNMALDAISGVLTWLPPQDTPATATVVLRAYDARGAAAQQAFGIDVAGGNRPPTLLGLKSEYTLLEGQLLRIPMDVVDADGQTVSLLMDRLPPGSVFDPVGRVFEWIPNFEQAGVYRDVRVRATDGRLTSEASIQITVLPANAPPLLNGFAPRNVREGDPIRVTFQALDVDGDPLRYRSPNLPSGALLNPITGEFEWTPDFRQAGVWSIAVWADDGRSNAETFFEVTVDNVNAPPEFDPLLNVSVLEGEEVSFRAFALDPDNPTFAIQDRLGDGALTPLQSTQPTVVYTALELPPGALFDADTAMLTWTPGFAQAGDYTLRFMATDDGNGTGVPLSRTVGVPVEVRNANRAPVVPGINNLEVAKGEVLDIPVFVTDADGNALDLRFDVTLRGLLQDVAFNGLPLREDGRPPLFDFVSTGNGTGVLRVAPLDRDRGDYIVTLVARDDGDGGGAKAVLSASRSFVVKVTSDAEPPLLAPIGSKVAVIGQPLQFTIRASDLDQDALQFSAQNLPDGATLANGVVYGTAIFTWTPTVADAGTHGVSFTVTDSTGGSDTRSIDLVVRATNAAPLLFPVGDLTVAENALLDIQLAATDGDGDALTYTATGLPPGAVLDPLTGRLLWKTNFFSAGTYNGVVLAASDGSASSAETIRITVTPTNQAPLLAALPPLGTQEQRVLQFTLVATDPDGDALTYTPVGNLPQGAEFDGSNGRFTWAPGYDQAGDYTLGFAARDAAGAQDTVAVRVSVADVNRLPVLAFTNHQVALGETLRFVVTGADADSNETLRFTTNGLPEGASFDTVTGQFSWTPGPGQVGDYLVVIGLNDGKSVVERGLALRVNAQAVGPKVTIVLTPSFPSVPGQPVAINVLADAFSAVAGRTLEVNGAPLALDANGRAVFTAPASGIYRLVATATDLDGYSESTVENLRVRDPLDSSGPDVSLSQALVARVLTAPTAIGGVVADRNLESWVLEIARFGSDQYQRVADGTAPIDGTLAVLDPSRFEAGPYQLRLTATDIAGRSALDTISVELRGAVSAARYTREDIDFSATLAGHTVEFLRRYDSLTGDRSGAFGSGWRLALRDVDLTTDLPAGGSEASGAWPPLVAGTRVFLTTPTGERVGFTFSPERIREYGITWYRPVWVADAGVSWQLESVFQKLLRAGDRFYAIDGQVPYNPAGSSPDRVQYTLVAADGTRYEIDAARGVTAIAYTDGVRLTVSDSGVAASNGDAVNFVLGAGGRIVAATDTGGRVFNYEYDSMGRLISARDLTAASSQRYAYDAAGRLSAATGGSASVALEYGESVNVRPLAGDLGAALAFLGVTRVGALAAGGSDLFTLSVRDSELRSAAGGVVLLGVAVEGSSGLAPALPMLNGATLVASRVQGGEAFALYRIDSAGLKLLTIGATAGGDYRLRIMAAGDVNGDQRVDGRDATLMAAARAGTPEAGADVDHDGDIDAADSQLLYLHLGFTPNLAPTVDAATFKTHVGLGIAPSLAQRINDPENDRVSLRVVSATNGTVQVLADGRTLRFKPTEGYFGEATVTVVADDGYTASAAQTFTFNVSNSPLLSIDFDRRDLKFRPGDQYALKFIGDFADEQDVELPADYLSLSSFDPSVAAVNAAGELTALKEGTGGLLVSRGLISAATAISVGTPRSAAEIFTYYFGIDAYPDTLSMTAGTLRQMVVQRGIDDVTDAGSGTRYIVGNRDLLSVTDDGKLTALAEGETTITVIHKSGEQVISVRVVQPVAGPATFGVEGGVVQGDGGQLIAFGRGQLAADASVEVTTLQASDLTVEIPVVMDYVAAFRLDVSGSGINGPLQMAIPVQGMTAGETVYFLREYRTDVIDGVMRTYWTAVDTGIVGADGYARSTSPPWPGLSSGGNILIAKGNVPLRTVVLDLDAWMVSSQLLMLGAATGSLIGLSIFGTAAVGVLIFPMVYNATIVHLYRSYADQVYVTPVPIDVGQTTTRIRAQIEQPATVPQSAPEVTAASFDVASGRITLTGTGFIDSNIPAGARVIFNEGGYEIDTLPVTASATSIVVEVPRTVVLGLADIYVERGQQTVSSSGGGVVSSTRWERSETSVRIDNPGGYGFVGTPSGVSVLDLQFMGQPGVEQVIQNIAVDTWLNPATNAIEDLARQVMGVVASTDLARIFAIVRADVTNHRPGAIAVIDGVALRRVDTNLSTVKIDLIELPYTLDPQALLLDPDALTPTAIALDPNGRYLYVGAAGKVFVVDIDPASETPYRVKTIPLPALTGVPFTGKINDMALNADGTRLYLTAPVTELYGPTPALAWTARGRVEGYVWVLNVDEADRPQPTPSNPLPVNPRKWHEFIAHLPGGLEPYGIKGTSDPDRMIFTSRLRGALDPATGEPTYKGLQTIQVTNGDPNGFAADVKSIALDGLTPNPSYREQLNVKNPADVAITPDMSYAFVSDWYLPLSVGSSSLVSYEETHNTGAKVTIIENPFGPSPKQLASTTPIPMGFANEIALSSDGKKLYVNYKGAGDVLVFDVQNLLARARAIPLVPNQNLINPTTGLPTVEVLDRLPIDDTAQFPSAVLAELASLDPATKLQVNLPAIQTGPAIRGLAVQPNDPLTLIAPIDTRDLQAPGATLTFKWKVDTSLLGTTNFTARLFLSTLPPGQGLWPSDATTSRTLLLEDAAPSTFDAIGAPDNNPNRVWTSPVLLSGDEEIDLPFSPSLLTAGQRYYWGVRIFANQTEYTESASFVAKPQTTSTVYNGVTVLTHGFQLNPTGGDERFAQPESFMLLAKLIADASGGGVVLSYDKKTGQWTDLSTGLSGVAALQAGKAVVLVSDWKKESDISDSGFAEAAAEALYTSLKDLDNKTGGALFGSKLHFIGHSRGTVVNSEIVQRLGAWDPGVTDIHMTTLDPHDFKQDALKVPIGSILGTIETALTIAQGAATVGSVFAPVLAPVLLPTIGPLGAFKSAIGTITSIASKLGIALDIPYDDFLDPDVKRWTNVAFLDNYYQTQGNGAISVTPVAGSVPFSPGSLTATPDGASIDTADINLSLDGVAGFTADDFSGTIPLLGLGITLGPTLSFELGLGGPHSRVWQWYAGTVDTSLVRFVDNPLYRRATDQGESARTVAGLPTYVFNDRPWYWAVPGTAPGTNPGGTPWTDPAAIWEGVASGWYFSEVAGGATVRPAAPAPTPPATAGEPVTSDNTEVTKGPAAVPNVFNGDFENGLRQSIWHRITGESLGRFPLSYELPGWSFHGGSGFSFTPNIPGVSVGTLDVTGLFVMETSSTQLVIDGLSKLYDMFAEKLIKMLGDKVIADLFGGKPKDPTPDSSPGYVTWFENNKLKYDAMEKVWGVIGSIWDYAQSQGIVALDLKDYFTVDGTTLNPIGLDNFKTALKTILTSWLKQELGVTAGSNYSLFMGGGNLLKRIIELSPIGLDGAELLGDISSFLAGTNLDTINHNRLMVPSSAMNQPVLAFSMLAPYIVSPNAAIQVTFKPTDMDPGLLEVVLPKVVLEPSFFQRKQYGVKVPDSFKGKAAIIEFKMFDSVADMSFTPISPDVTAPHIDLPGSYNLSLAALDQIIFLDDVRFTAGLQAVANTPVDEASPVVVDVSFAASDVTKPTTLTATWQNTGVVQTVTLAPGVMSHHFTYTYPDDFRGDAADNVTIEVEGDNVIGLNHATAHTRIRNVAPELGPLVLSDPQVDEGGTITLTGTFTDPALALDDYEIRVQWGDGEESFATVLTKPTAGAAGTFSATHLYEDDAPSKSTPFDELTIKVTIEDDDLGADSETKKVKVIDQAPRITTLSFDDSDINEGETATLRGTVSDAGVHDVLTATLSFNGSTLVLPVSMTGPGAGTFVFSLPVTDDDPSSGTPLDNLRVDVMVEDDDGGQVSDFEILTVHNVAPTLGVAMESALITEGEFARVLLTFSDPSPNDTLTATLNWDDGVTQIELIPAGSTSWVVERLFADDDPSGTTFDLRTVAVTLEDDDLGVATGNTAVTVKNSDPDALFFPDIAVATGEDFLLKALFFDAGLLDTHQFLWEITDETDTVVYQSHELEPTTSLAVAGTYLAELHILDDDDGEGGYSLEIAVVQDLLMTWDANPLDTTLREGDTATIEITAPGIPPGGYYTADIDWGDGTVDTGLVMPPAALNGQSLLPATHVYRDDQPNGHPDLYEATVSFHFTFASQSGQIPPERHITFNVVNATPQAAITVTPPAQQGGAFTFTANASDVGVLDTLVYTWDFGDGTVVTNAGPTATHAFSRPSTVTLRVDDDDGGFVLRSVSVSPGTAQGAVAAYSNAGLRAEQLAPLQQVAIDAWAAIGANTDPLADVRLIVTDLGGDLLGLTYGGIDGTSTVYLDDDAGGRGWFVDATPAVDEEFVAGQSAWQLTAVTGAAAGRIDLLTLLQHEFGHVLGFEHAAPGSLRLMDMNLSSGERRMPTVADMVAADAGTDASPEIATVGVANGNFTNGTGWSTRGAVSFENNQARLVEDQRVNTSLSQLLRIPSSARFLSFDVFGLEWGSGGGIGDAFEVALRDATTGNSLLGPIGMSQTDALINVQADGRVHAAAGVTFDDLAITQWPGGNADVLRVRIDVSAVADLRAALLSFDLIGFNAGGSRVSIANVAFDATVNTPPLAANDRFVTNVNTPVVLDVLGNDSDIDGDRLTVEVVSAPSNGRLEIGPDGTLTYRPNSGFVGADAFFYRVGDRVVLSSPANVSIDVIGANSPPVALPDNLITAEDTPLTFDPRANDSDAEGSPLTVQLIEGPLHGSAVVLADGRVTYTPDANYFGTDTFDYRVSDGVASSSPAQVNLNITPVNDAPVAVDDAAATDEDTLVVIAVLGNDTDVDSSGLTATLVGGASHGTVTPNADGTFSYAPGANFNGSDSFTYRASDGALDSNVVTVTVTVAAVNDAPVAVDDAAATDEDTLVVIAVLGNDTDVDSSGLTVTLVGGAAYGTVTPNADGTFSYAPIANFNGTDSFSYRANDGALDSIEATVSITVAAVNDAPVAQDGNVETDEDTALNGQLVATDVDNAALTFAIEGGPAHGALAVETDGRFTYTPAQDFNGSDTFTYRASDGSLGSIAAVSIAVNPVNDRPVARTDTYDADEDTVLTIAGPGVLGNDTDVDSAELTATPGERHAAWQPHA